MPELPYASSKAGAGREKEIRDVLRSVGASAVDFMVDDDRDIVICQFRMAAASARRSRGRADRWRCQSRGHA
jgi:hypothetical protein